MVIRPRMVHLVSGLLLIVIFSLSAQALSSVPGSRVDAAPQVTYQNFTVTYDGRVSAPASNRTVFIYTVSGKGVPPALSSFELQIPTCTPPLEVAATNPTEGGRFGVDPTTRLDGITWDRPLQVNDSYTYSVTFTGKVEEGTTQAAVKTESGSYTVSLPGPACATSPANSVDVEEYVSSDLVNWADVDTAPGAMVPVGSDVWFRFVIRNNSTRPLSRVALTDSTFDLRQCGIPRTLGPGQSVECNIGPASAVTGQHSNTTTVEAVSGSMTVSDTDSAHFYGGDIQLPLTTIIEGAVQSINTNILIIDGMNVELDPNNPFLNLLRVGNLVRAEGNLVVDGDTSHLAAVYVTMLDTRVAFYRDALVRSDTGVAASQATGNAGSANAVSAPAAPAPAAPAPAAPAPAAPAPAAPVDAGSGSGGTGNEGGGNKHDEGGGRGNRNDKDRGGRGNH